MAANHRLREFIQDLAELVEISRNDAALLDSGAALLRKLVAEDDWLPEIYAWPDPEHHRQYLLYCDPRERFSVVSFVWGPGQATPIHDHGVWGLIGVLRGAETSERFTRDGGGRLKPAGRVASGSDGGPAPRGPEGRYKRPYQGNGNKAAAMQAYLDWEFGLGAQLERDGTFGFFVI